MKPEWPYELEPHELSDWAHVWGRWRNNANVLMLWGLSQREAEDTAAIWPVECDRLLELLDPRLVLGLRCRYDDHGVIILEEANADQQ